MSAETPIKGIQECTIFMSTTKDQPKKEQTESKSEEPERVLTCGDLICRLVFWECWQCYQIEQTQSQLEKHKALFDKENHLKGQEIAQLQLQVIQMQEQLQMMQKKQEMKL
jgi:hypothetical protein